MTTMTAMKRAAAKSEARSASSSRLAANIFCALLFLRLMADFEGVPGGLQAALNQGIIFAAIGCGFIYSTLTIGRTKRITLPIMIVILSIWFLIGVAEEGFMQPLTSAYLRFLALLGMVVLARVAVRALGPVPFLTRVVWVSFPAVALVTIGVLTRSPLLFSSGTGRAFGTFNHTNSAASFVAVYVLVLVFLLMRQRKWRYFGLLVIALLAVVGTLSLGGLSSLAVGIVLLLFMSGARARVKVAAAVVLAGAAVVVFASGALDSRLSQLETTVSFDDATSATSTNSLDWRFYNWRRVLAIWAQRPFFGYGLGRADLDLQPIGKQPHNEYVRALVETGILGTVLLAVIVAVIIASLAASRTTERWGKALAISTLVTLLVNALASNTTSYAPTMMLCVATWAVGVAMNRGSDQDSLPTGRRTGKGAVRG